jgi:hypothetical protein
MTDTKRPLKVFLCHAHADRDAVKALYARLIKDGVDAWLDKEKLLPGQDWELEIRKAVREADVVVVCLSKQFNQAGFRQKEVRLALDTAMEQPEGEIFIIPARLEECDTLESLRKWHWVDLFEENGYEMLLRALRARANNIGIEIKSDELITPERPLLSSPSSTVVDGLNWETVSSSTIFYSRICDAFPGVRGSEGFGGREAVDRLSVLLRHPLSVNRTDSPLDGQITPIWWTRGRADMHVSNFEALGEDRVLIDILELYIERVIAVREFSAEERNFVYVQTLPDKPTGLYNYSKNWLQDHMQFQLKNNWGYYYFEEYGLWNNKAITRQEYDDGSAVINGKPTRVSGAQLRLRYITPYNFILCGGDHVLFNDGGNIPAKMTTLLDELLLGKITFTDLVSFVGDLPITSKYM